MEEDTRIIVEIRLEKCKEDLKYARLLWENGAYRIAVSRTYYAVHAIASAALLTLGISRSKHSGILSAFNQFLIKPGLIEPEYGLIYKRLLKARQEADYSDSAFFSKGNALDFLKEAERFVARLEKYLKV